MSTKQKMVKWRESMKKIEIELTNAQEKYLKNFYKNHKEGAHDNLCTYMPIHVVEEIRYTYIPYKFGIEDYSVNGHIAFYETGAEHMYHSIDDLTNDWNDNVDEDYKILPFKEVEGKTINEIYILDEEDYINAYQIENIEVVYAIASYAPVAFFFIREEAIKYLQYQSHNLTKPRVFSYSPGYRNNGEYEHFYSLLQNIGEQLNLTKDVK